MICVWWSGSNRLYRILSLKWVDVVEYVDIVREFFLRLNIRKRNCSKLMAQVDVEIKPFYLNQSKTDFQSKAV